MNKLEIEIKKLIDEREAAHERMVEEFDRAENNPTVQPSIAYTIGLVAESVEQLKRFHELVIGRKLL